MNVWEAWWFLFGRIAYILALSVLVMLMIAGIGAIVTLLLACWHDLHG